MNLFNNYKLIVLAVTILINLIIINFKHAHDMVKEILSSTISFVDIFILIDSTWWNSSNNTWLKKSTYSNIITKQLKINFYIN